MKAFSLQNLKDYIENHEKTMSKDYDISADDIDRVMKNNVEMDVSWEVGFLKGMEHIVKTFDIESYVKDKYDLIDSYSLAVNLLTESDLEKLKHYNDLDGTEKEKYLNQLEEEGY
tara:strand:+ start:129 stop:473 length:345 start_codon:yes stop_codon:yes gene_type:complete